MATSIDTSKVYVMINIGSETGASASNDGITAVGNKISFKDTGDKLKWTFVETGETLPNGKVYRIRNVETKKYLLLQDKGDGKQVTLDNSENDRTRWIVFRQDYSPYPTFRIQSVPWGTVLDMKDGKSSDDTPIQSWDWTNSVNEKWMLIALI